MLSYTVEEIHAVLDVGAYDLSEGFCVCFCFSSYFWFFFFWGFWHPGYLLVVFFGEEELFVEFLYEDSFCGGLGAFSFEPVSP